MWTWLRTSLVPGLRVPKWYNGDPPIGLRGFLADRSNRLMGYGTLRQVRTLSGQFIQKLLTHSFH